MPNPGYNIESRHFTEPAALEACTELRLGNHWGNSSGHSRVLYTVSHKPDGKFNLRPWGVISY